MLSPHPTIKVYGCGSAGMHIAHAARTMGWPVDMVDPDPAARERMPRIYSARYGVDPEIGSGIALFASDYAPTDDYDICVISTPPTTHIELALQAWEKHDPHAVLIEKPLCSPSQVSDASALQGTRTFVGYTHLMTAGKFNMRGVRTLETEFREAWKFVLKAHPWNKAPEDTYLGDASAGGGACGEHSHAINLWEHYARPEHGEVDRVVAQMAWSDKYDTSTFLQLDCEDGFRGEVIMDTLADPAFKLATAKGDNGAQQQQFTKCDFIAELQHVWLAVQNGTNAWMQSPLTFERGWRTARIIAAAHKSAAEGRPVCLA